MAFNVDCRPRTGMCRGRPFADPEASGRPSEDRPAGCCQPGQASPAGELTAAWVPDARHEAIRDLVRARLDAVHSLRRVRQQLSGFLLSQGCHYGRPAWTKLHRCWLAGLTFDHAVHHIVLEDYIAAIEVAQARRDRLTAQIETMLPDWTLAPVVAALQTMRGMALVNAATLIAELGDLSRFANPCQLMTLTARRPPLPQAHVGRISGRS
jgi:transposase